MTVFNSLIEYSRNGANLTPIGTVGTGPNRDGVAGEAMTFTDVDNSYYQSTITSDDITGSFTAIHWINQSSTAPDARVVSGVYDTTEADGQFRLFVLSDNTLRFGIIDDTDTQTTVDSTRIITNSTWEPVAIVFDDTANLIKVYTKQGLDNSLSFTGTLNAPTAINFRIGGYPAAAQRPFDGSIGGSYLVNEALTTQQIADVFSFTIPNEIYGAVSAVPLGDFGSSSVTEKINLLDLSAPLAVTGTVLDVADEQSAINASSEWTGAADSACRVTDAGYNLTNSFWVSGKVKVDALGTTGWIATQHDAGLNIKFIFVKTTADTILFRVYDTLSTQINAFSTTTVSINTEYPAFAVYDSILQELRLYINGVLEATTPMTTTPGSTGNLFAVGNYTTNSVDASPDAIVDDVSFGSGVPSLSEIQAITALSTNFQEEHGILQVDITGPDTATWSAFDGVTTYGPFVGNSAHDLPPEIYTISFSAEVGFTTPSDITGFVIADQTNYLQSAEYFSSVVGDLTITITGSAEPDSRWYASSTTTPDVYGPFPSGQQPLPVDTYDVSFLDVRGNVTPSDINGLVVTEGGSTSDSAIYIAGPSEYYIRPAGQVYGNSSGDSYVNAISGLSNVNQWELQLSGFIRIRGEHKEGIVLTYPDITLNFDGDSDNGIINGKTEVVNTWTLHSGNIWKVQTVVQPNIDYNQQTEPVSPSVGERWYLPIRAVGTRYGQTGYIWDGSLWQPDPSWFIQPQLVWLDDVRVNSSKSTALEFKEIDGTMAQTSMSDSDLSGEIDNYWQNGTVVFKYLTWVAEVRNITSSTGSSITYPITSVRTDGGFVQEFYYVENVIGECASVGDWAYQDGFLYMYFTSDPNTAGNKVEYSGVNHGVYGVDVDDITIDKANIINTNDSAIRLIGCDNPIVTDPVIDTIYPRGDFAYSAGAIDLWGLDPRDYDPVAVRQGDFSGITRKTNVSVTGAKISNVHAGTGIYTSMYDASGVGDIGEIQGNTIRNCGFSPTETFHMRLQPMGILSYGSDSVNINESNDIKYVSSNGIINLSSGDALVQNNRIDNYLRNTRDGGGIYCYGVPANNNTISNNVISNGIASDYDTDENAVTFIYTDEFSHDNLIEDNICAVLQSPNQTLKIFALFNNNSTETPPNVYQNNVVYADNLTVFEQNDFGPTHATFISNTLYTEAQAITITPTITGSDDGRLDVNGIEYADSEVAYINAGLVSPTWEAVPEYNSPSAITPFTAVLSTDYPVSGEYVVAGIALTAQDITTGFPTIGTPILNNPIIPIDLISQDITTGIPTIGQPRLNFTPRKASNFRTLTVSAGGSRNASIK